MIFEPTFDVRAEFVGAAALFAWQNEGFYDGNCVYVLPGLNGGAIIWAMNGHHAIFIYDDEGKAAFPLRVSLHKELIKACGCGVDTLIEKSRKLQATSDLDRLRVEYIPKGSTSPEYVDFTPAPALKATNAPGYATFLSKYADAKQGIISSTINGNSMAIARKVFKDGSLFTPTLHQAGTEGPVYMTFTRVPGVLIVTMPFKDAEDALAEDETGDKTFIPRDYYSNFSDAAMSFLASPYAGGVLHSNPA